MSFTPTPSPTPFSSQVGGHPGLLTIEDGSLLIKPALPLELQFYQTTFRDDAFEPLRPFIPKFYGVLKLEGKVDEQKPDEEISLLPIEETVEEDKDEHFPWILYSIVLENLCYSFLKPNILDIKLGTTLHDESATPEKRARMEKKARETTSLETGIRLTGFQVHDNKTSQPVSTPKSYGTSIKASDLPDGITRFFPVPGTSSAPTSSVRPSPTADLGLSPSLLLPILVALHADIADIRKALAEVHARMVASSLLIVYEADRVRAEEGIKKFLSWIRVSAEGSGDEESAHEDPEEGGDEGEDDEEDNDSEEDEEGKPKRTGPPYAVKLIDFAHTRLVPGQGPDEGVLLGLDTVLRLLDGRIAEIKEILEQPGDRASSC